jgi:ATP-dependent Clp protease ATP-binding subunit ClpC
MNWFKSILESLSESLRGENASVVSMVNFAPRAMQVFDSAKQEAERLNHEFIGTVHVLPGLVQLGQGVAFNVLKLMGLNLETVREKTKELVGVGPGSERKGPVQLSPHVISVLSAAQKEARALNHTYVGTEHILLGLLLESDSVAAQILHRRNVDINQTRRTILKELDP